MTAAGWREQGQEARDRGAVAFDREVARAAAVPEYAGECGGVGVDRRVGLIGGPARDVEPAVGDAGVEVVLAEPQLVARAEAAGGGRVEQRLER